MDVNHKSAYAISTSGLLIIAATPIDRSIYMYVCVYICMSLIQLISEWTVRKASPEFTADGLYSASEKSPACANICARLAYIHVHIALITIGLMLPSYKDMSKSWESHHHMCLRCKS